MDSIQRSESLALSSLVSVLAGFVVIASMLFAQAPEIAEAVVSSEIWDSTMVETLHGIASLLP